MNWKYPYWHEIDLYVKDRIEKEDSERQKNTAIEILKRLEAQPGLILADEVGMGKTFVALAVAVSVAVNDRKKRPVVIMVPSSLKNKWPKEFSVFLNKCLNDRFNKKIRCEKAQNTVEFLKLLDDEDDSRCNLIFLTHGALHCSLSDPWVKLAFIQKALYRRKNTDNLYKSLNKFAGSLLFLKYIEKNNNNIFGKLLGHNPTDWKKILVKNNVFTKDKDDPVPMDLIKLLKRIENKSFNKLFELLSENLPERKTKNTEQIIKNSRQLMNAEFQNLWKICISLIKPSSPLLIFDEAHHLKNAKTRVAGLFNSEDEKEDAIIVSKGLLSGVFERMLFLTATPFQLGHHELCNILDRFSGIKWKPDLQQESGESIYKKEVLSLRKILDCSHESAFRFDKVWGNLTEEELKINEVIYDNTDKWWKNLCSTEISKLSSVQQILLKRFEEVNNSMKSAESLLKKYVIRHIKSKTLCNDSGTTARRSEIVGAGVITDDIITKAGIVLSGNSFLPFLLSARLASLSPESRPVFSEGLSSSFEAFLETRARGIEKNLDDDDLSEFGIEEDKQSSWYLDNIQNSIRKSFKADKINHPKIEAVAEKAINLWSKGEKVLIFCHYIETGKALRYYITTKLEKIIREDAAIKMKCPKENVFDEFEKIGQRFESEKYLLRREFDKIINNILTEYEPLKELHKEITEIIRRFFKSTSFLLRFYPLENDYNNSELLVEAFARKDNSGKSLLEIINNFLFFLSFRCVTDERKEFIDALKSVQPGAYELKMIKIIIPNRNLTKNIYFCLISDWLTEEPDKISGKN